MKSKNAKKVIVYGTQTCIWCKRAKNFLNENKIKFTFKDVGSNAKYLEEMIKLSGVTTVPVIDVDGVVLDDYDEEKLKKLLKMK